jgi:carboxyl-terminal processing protease
MNRRIVLVGFVLLMAFLVLGFRIYDSLAEPIKQEETAYSNIAVLTHALQLIRQDYVEDKKISYRDLTYAALRGMLASLDPHSSFMEPDAFKDMQDDTKSQFGGLGVVVSLKDGFLTIVTPMEDSPGFKAGLLPGDRIVKINGVPAEKMELNDAVQKLRGNPGEKVSLTVFRSTVKEVKDFVIERAVIKIDSVKDAKILSPDLTGNFKVGYVRITQFNEPTAKELSAKLDGLEAQGMNALILDLRLNPGGLLNSAVDVCGQFLPSGEMVVYTEGRAASQKRIYKTPEKGKPRPNYPVAVLINGGSASGAEIVAGALKDLNRAILVGETTFGKGSVQSVIALQDGSALRLTTAKYYTPSKQVIHEHGVTPNILATMTPNQERLLVLQRRPELLTDSEKKEVASFRDTQLERAVDALKGVMIYADRSGGTKSAKAAEKPAVAN